MDEDSYKGDFESGFSSPIPTQRTMMSDDDDEGSPGLERGHSLPNVEEMRINTSSSGKLMYDEQGHKYMYPSEKKYGVLFTALFLALVVIGASVGIALSVQNKGKNSTASIEESPTETPKEDNGDEDPNQDIDIENPIATKMPTTAPETVAPETDIQIRTNQIKLFLADCGISEEKMSTEGSPHLQALTFLSEEDKIALDVPAEKDTTEGYSFLTRYVLSLLFYTLNGPQWQLGLNFLSAVPVCAWGTNFRYSDGRREFRGVSCNTETVEIEALYLGEYMLMLFLHYV